MPSPTTLPTLDRLSAHSVLRGSTSSLCGILGTLLVVVLCLVLYAPAISDYLQGDYFQSEFFHQGEVKEKLYSDRDFKIAIQFRSKANNSVANHTAILSWAYAQFYQLVGDWQNRYHERSWQCQPNYFQDAINPVLLEDCFMFPQHSLLDIISDWGYYTAYTNLFFWLYPQSSLDPFASATDTTFLSNYQFMQQLRANYYYVVYFTSKIVDPSSGKASFQVNRFYSTQNNFNSNQAGAQDLLVWNHKHYKMDLSVMPWVDFTTASGLVWLGKSMLVSQQKGSQAVTNGIEVNFSLNKYNIMAYRYYRKLDWLLGIIGGAMLLFYIIFWLPCSYINRTLHVTRNVPYFLLNNLAKEGKPITQDDVVAADVSLLFWVSNSIVDFFCKSTKKASQLVQRAEQQLDIVRLVKKLKVVQRTLKKKQLLTIFKQKNLDLQVIKKQLQIQIDRQSGQQSDQSDSVNSSQVELEQIQPQEVLDLSVDDTFGLTDFQFDFMEKKKDKLSVVYQNNITPHIIMKNKEQTVRLQRNQKYRKMPASYSSQRKLSCPRRVIACLSTFIQKLDFFGFRVNLSVQPHGSSCIGCCGTFLIVTMAILSVAMTLHHANIPQIMIDHNHQDQADFSYQLQSGEDLKLAVCFDKADELKGTNRKADLKFFSQSSQKGRRYFQPQALSTADFDTFELSAATSSIILNTCFGIPQKQKIIMAKSPSSYGYFGFKIQPYCASTTSYCTAYKNTLDSNFLAFINTSSVNLFLPQNRFDAQNARLINSLVQTKLNVNIRALKNTSALEETLFVDHVQLIDDTKNWFMRRQGKISHEGLAANINTLMPLSKNIAGNPYYEVRIRPSSNQINYIMSTKKADMILGIIGGVFVFYYALFHWIGKIYNNYNTRAKLASQIYGQDSANQSVFNKYLTVSPLPSGCLPSCGHIRNDVIRMRQIQKKIKNDLNYIWLVRQVDNVYMLSSSLFGKIQQKNFSLVSIKDKIDESQYVKSYLEREEQEELEDSDYVGINEQPNQQLQDNYNRNKVYNQGELLPQNSMENLSMTKTASYDKGFRKVQRNNYSQNEQKQRLTDNFMHGLPKQPKYNAFDTFQYPASLTLNGQRQSTSCCGGCCCLILLIFIIIIGIFQLRVYMDKDDARIGMTTSLMQPLGNDQNSTYNSLIHLQTGKNFKLAVTFSSEYQDYPQNVTNWTNSAVGISIYQQTFSLQLGSKVTRTIQFPLTACPSTYFSSWMNPLSDPSYYPNSTLGYCIPDNITLQIDGLPQDIETKRFTLSIHNKLGTIAGNLQLKQFMELYLPKFHFSNPVLDPSEHQFDYYMTQITFDAFNVSHPVSQNISLQKVVVLYDDQIAFQGEQYRDIAYSFTEFQQFQTQFNDFSNPNMSYNLSFANSYLVKYYTFSNQKFVSTFGIIGGLVAFFIFGFGCCARSFNKYKMKYEIGKELYLFDLVKKKQARRQARGRKKKTAQEKNKLSDLNNMNQAQILEAFLLSIIARFIDNYNISQNLRHITLIQHKVEKDIDLFQVYKKLHHFRDIVNRKIDVQGYTLTNIYHKKIYQPNPDTGSLTDQKKLLNFAKKNNWSSFQQFAVWQAAQQGVNPKNVLDNAFLQKQFQAQNESRTAINASQLGANQESMGHVEMAHFQIEEIPME